MVVVSQNVPDGCEEKMIEFEWDGKTYNLPVVRPIGVCDWEDIMTNFHFQTSLSWAIKHHTPITHDCIDIQFWTSDLVVDAREFTIEHPETGELVRVLCKGSK